jgi:hypothetical protein
MQKEPPFLQIHAISAFTINTMRNYALNPLRYVNHLHTDLLRYANDLSKIRDDKGLTIHIGKVKSHTGVTYNDEAGTYACRVVDGKILPYIGFTAAYPPHRGPQNMAFYTTHNRRSRAHHEYRVNCLTYTPAYANS